MVFQNFHKIGDFITENGDIFGFSNYSLAIHDAIYQFILLTGCIPVLNRELKLEIKKK